MSEQWPGLHGGTLCLDFVNTVEPRFRADGHDWITGYGDLARWAQHVGLVTPAQKTHLNELAGRHERTAAQAFESAIALREAVYRIFSALVDQSTPDRKDLDLLSDAYAEASRHQRLTVEKGHIGLGWDAGDDELRQIAWPVARDALDLATSGPLDRLKRCPEKQGGCAWLFIDGSKNGSRRWCSMQDCGSRVKSRRQNQRLRTEHP